MVSQWYIVIANLLTFQTSGPRIVAVPWPSEDMTPNLRCSHPTLLLPQTRITQARQLCHLNKKMAAFKKINSDEIKIDPRKMEIYKEHPKATTKRAPKINE